MAKNRKRQPQADEPADSEAAPEEDKKATADTADDDMHAEAIKRYERGWERDRKNMERAYEDLRFLAEEGQWEDRARREREAEGRPILTVNKCPQFVRQVTGDMRQMRPAIKVVPVDDAASQQVADKILPGMIRYIERRSDAAAAYFNAADSQVGAGIGHWRVLREYASNTTFNQELRIAPIEDGVAVVWDPDSILPTRDDAMWCFVPVDMSRAAFEEKYPDKSGDALPSVPALFHSWFTEDHVRIAEYFYKEAEKHTLAMLPDGSIVDITDMEPGDPQLLDVMIQQPDIEERDGFCVYRCVISASDVIEEPEKEPGAFIPIVPLLGEEIKIGREVIRRGVVRALKDVQRLYNYAISADAEVVALQPKAPYKGTRKNFEKYQDQWETANSRNWPYLEYEPDPTNGGAAPQREPPPLASSGIKDLLAVSSADMSAVTGIYPSSLGQASNETSGKAIMARQREGDTGTYVYVDNFGRAIRRTAQILIDLISHVYDTERTIHIVGEDGKVDIMKINQAQLDPNGDGIATNVLNDVTIGAYEVAVEMGPSYSTKREEARDGMQALMQSLGPQSALMFSDLFVKSQDFPLADKIAKRAQLLLPPQIQQMEAQEAGEPPPPQMPPPPPTPEQQAEMAKMQQEGQFNQARLQIDSRKIDAEMAKVNAELEKARLDHTATMAGHAVSARAAEMGAQAAQTPQEPAQDPRVDELAQAVMQLRDIVVALAQAVQGNGGPPPDAGPNPIPFGMTPPPGAPPGPGPQSPMPPAPPPSGVFAAPVPQGALIR